MRKVQNAENNAIITLLSVFPPLAFLFVVVGWFKGKASPLSVVTAFVAIALSIIFIVQLYRP